MGAGKVRRAIGLMSGTSLDGIDVALMRTDGQGHIEPGAALTIPYDAAMQSFLRDAVQQAADMQEAEQRITRVHAEAVDMLLKQEGLKADDIDVIGFHGQTVRHEPDAGITWQLGDGSLLAELTGIDVVCDFRRRDVAAGGQGAPLVPLFHAALVGQAAHPVAVINIGGIANISWVGVADPAAPELLAFDTGPGNALLNSWLLRHDAGHFDEGGRIAARGRVDESLLQRWLDLPFFAAEPPKSLDRHDFDAVLMNTLSLEDGAATLTAYVVHGIAKAAEHCPERPEEWIVCGGGRHNPEMMRHLRALLGEKAVRTAEDKGWDGDALEAQAFAWLAVRSLDGLPLSLPTTTGCHRPVTGGALYRK